MPHRAKARNSTVSGRASDRMVPVILLFRNPHWGLHATWMNCSRLMYTNRDPFELFAASVSFSRLMCAFCHSCEFFARAIFGPFVNKIATKILNGLLYHIVRRRTLCRYRNCSAAGCRNARCVLKTRLWWRNLSRGPETWRRSSSRLGTAR